MEKRIFIGIQNTINPSFAKNIINIQDKLNNHAKIKWVKIENIHITLNFLGNTPNEKIPIINNEVQQICNQNKEFSITLRKIGTFPNIHNPKVLWIGIDNYSPLLSIYEKINNSMLSNNITFDNKPFAPHLTLGRFQHLYNPNILKEIITNNNKTFDIWNVSHIKIFESILYPTGPVYKVLYSCQLT